MEEYFNCVTCRYRYNCFPNMDDYEVSEQKNICNGKNYEREE